jgi:stage II sporulation protein D
VKRGAGGVAEELLIRADSGTYKILSEYNIRRILCDGMSEAVKQDNSTTVPGTLLPSGFFVLEAGKRDGNVVGYTLTGGGYGHGAGMSQNGARALGEADVSYRAILTFFFPGCELDSIS